MVDPGHGLSGGELGRSPPGVCNSHGGSASGQASEARSWSGRILLGTPPALLSPWPTPPPAGALCLWGVLASLYRQQL